jgi:hypothetical protein
MIEGVSQIHKEKVKIWNALIVWSDNETMLSDISRFFNSLNKITVYQASWIRNIIASKDVWEFYVRPPKEKDNAKDKNPRWEVSMVWTDQPKLLFFCMCSLDVQFGSIDPNYCIFACPHEICS